MNFFQIFITIQKVAEAIGEKGQKTERDRGEGIARRASGLASHAINT
jgi:hypothetical protein